VRKVALIGSIAIALVAVLATLVPRVGHAAQPLSLARAANRTLAVQTQRFATDVEVARSRQRVVLHVRGATAPGATGLHVTVEARRRGGAAVPLMSGAALLDGPFLYVHAPSGLVVNGTARWLRTRVAALPPTSPELRMLHAMSSEPLLRLLAVTHTTALAVASGVYRGTVQYDDPVVVAALDALTNRTQFRDLQVTAVVGADGLVHRLRLTGRTADGHAKLRVDARLYSFGRPVHLAQPRQQAFLDQQEPRLAT
jgi:hypothetical protein